MARRLETILREIRIRDLPLDAPCRVDQATPLAEVNRLLDEEHPGAVVVCDGDDVVGIFTERDVLRRTALEALAAETPIASLMTPRPTSLAPTQRLAEAIQAMTEGGHRHVPLVDARGAMVGVVSSRDILRFLAGYFPEAVLNLPPRLHQTLPRAEGG